MKKLLLGFLCCGLLAVPGAVPAQDESGAKAPVEDPAPKKYIKLYAENWKWIPKVIRVEQGTRLIVDAHSYDAPHSFELKAYKLKVPMPENQSIQFEFVADKVGEFSWRCGRPCGNGCPKMRGKLIVEEAAAE